MADSNIYRARARAEGRLGKPSKKRRAYKRRATNGEDNGRTRRASKPRGRRAQPARSINVNGIDAAFEVLNGTESMPRYPAFEQDGWDATSVLLIAGHVIAVGFEDFPAQRGTAFQYRDEDNMPAVGYVDLQGRLIPIEPEQVIAIGARPR